MNTSSNISPLLVAIVGGSGAGKSWLADRLQARLGACAARLSLDDFYLDRSHLPAGRRARINFDHPRAIDWPRLTAVLHDFRSGRGARVPCYDFTCHARREGERMLPSKPILLVDGLWLFRRPDLRRLFEVRIFIECKAELRLRRRLERDLATRGRSEESVHQQFRETVEPMNARFVTPQARWAHVVLQAPIREDEVEGLARRLGERRGNL